MKPEHLDLLAKVPLLLNSSLESRHVIDTALNHLQRALNCEATTIFLREDKTQELTIWALKGGGEASLAGKKMPSDKGIVGSVIKSGCPELVNNVQNDKRFFNAVDEEGKFITRNMICVPLSSRGKSPFGALQAINKKGEELFTEEDLEFVERYALLLALAVDNAKLFHSLQSRTQLLESLDRKKDAMISMIVHEFQTPLNLILTSSDLIASGAISDQAMFKKLTQTLMDGVVRLSKIVNEVKNASLLTERELPVKKAPFDLSSVAKLVQNHFKTILEKRKLTLKTELDSDAVSAIGDSSLVLVVLKNLISNAIRFTPDGGTITLRTALNTGMIEIQVEDTGIGIEPSQQDAIFEKFYEVTDIMYHSSGDYQFKSCGLGLGLPTARAILTAHAASLRVTSAPKQGSVFSFRLHAP